MVGRPKGTGHPMSKHAQMEHTPKLISPDEAKEIVENMDDRKWNYSDFIAHIQRGKLESMQIMNELIHYGLMKVTGQENKSPVFEKMTEDDEW